MNSMADEAIIRDRLDIAIDFTCADGTGIEKGALLALTDPRTAIAPTAAGQALAGIAAREKIANDGRTQIAVYRKGIFDMRASGAIAIGAPVMAAVTPNTNFVIAAPVASAYSGASFLGHALEAADDSEVVQIYVNVGGGH